MRILYHHRTLGDGAEGIHITEMVSALRALGHVVEVRGLAADGRSVARHGLVPRLKRYMPSAAFEIVSLAGNVPDYLDTRRAVDTLRPDFVYKRHARLDVGALRAARAAGVPSLLEVNCLFTAPEYHQFEPLSLPRLAARYERQALKLAGVVVAVSTPLAQAIERLSGVRAVVLPNGADPERFDPARANRQTVRARLGLGDALTIGWAGVMRDWHGLGLLLQAVAAIPDVRLLLVGDGPARPSVEREAAAAGIAERLVITGRVPAAEMPDYLAAMDVAVVASDRTQVASPMKLVEYMAMERVVVAPRLDNIRDLVSDGRDGLLFTPENADDLTGVLRRLIGDAPLRQTLGAAARQTVLGTRTWRRNAERVLALMSEQNCALEACGMSAPTV
jgi:glycosyltransferase involved in cell wall biosynthesis